MPSIHQLGNLKIVVYADDHNPPHFHIVTPDAQALVRIADLEIISSRNLRRADLRAALDWADANRKVLEDAWNQFNP